MPIASYDPVAVLRTLDAHPLPVLVLVGVAGAGTFGYLILSFRTAARDRAFPASPLAVGFFAVHDLTFVAASPTWFGGGPLSHWWTMTWAPALAVTSVIELLLFYQVFRFGREELAPGLGRAGFAAALVAALVGITAAWLVVRRVMADDLFLISFALTAWMGPVFSAVLALRRGSRRGQTVGMAWCLVLIQAGMFPAWMILDPWFREPAFVGLAVSAWACSLATVWLLRRLPPPASGPVTTAGPVITAEPVTTAGRVG